MCYFESLMFNLLVIFLFKYEKVRFVAQKVFKAIGQVSLLWEVRVMKAD